jgi:hypothetical protein
MRLFHYQPRNQNVSGYFDLRGWNENRNTGTQLAELMTRYSQAVRRIEVAPVSFDTSYRVAYR